MFKNLSLYRIQGEWPADLAQAEADLARRPFAPCMPTQELAMGWVPPRGQQHAALVESVGGQWLMVLRLESRVLPADVVARGVDELAAQIEAQTGRKPGKRERRDLKDEVRLSLLPRAFTKQAHVRIWLAPQQGWVALDAASSARTEQALAALLEALPTLRLTPLQTAQSAAACMAGWLVEREPPAGFSVDREAELRAADESRAVVRYSRHALDTDEVVQHVRAGLMPTRLALTWADRVSFVLTDTGLLKRIAFTDTVFDQASTDKADDFDGSWALFTGEMTQLLPELIDALGGEAPLIQTSGVNTGASATAIVSPPSTPVNAEDPPF